MSQNVWEQIGAKSTSLQEKLEQNTDVANTVMSLLGNLIVVANAKGVPFEGICFGELHETGGEFTSKIGFSTLNIGLIPQVTARFEFMDYAKARSWSMARALERSPRMQTFFEALVQAVEKYSLAKGIPFQALKVYKRIVTPDNVLVFKVGREVL
jgi:hypothetical protein